MFFWIGLIVGVLGASIILFSGNEKEYKITAFTVCSIIYGLLSWWIF